jgi:hypothetical protein
MIDTRTARSLLCRRHGALLIAPVRLPGPSVTAAQRSEVSNRLLTSERGWVRSGR